MHSILWPLILLTSLLAGCAGQPARTSSADPASFEVFSEELEQSMVARDGSFFISRLDVQQFARRSMSSLGVPVARKKSIDTYANTLQGILERRFSETFSTVESARFIRLLPNESGLSNEAVALIRIEPEDGGINYWKIYLQQANGRISIVDWLNYSLGDTASHAIGDFSLRIGKAVREPESEDARVVKAYLTAAKSGDPQQLINAYDQLSQGLRENALLMYAYLQAASQVSDETHKAALSGLAPRYRKDDAYALLLVDYYLMNKEYENAHQAIDSAVAHLGADAGLDALHAGLSLDAGDYKNSISYARDGIRREPDYLNNYWILLDALVYSKNYADAIVVLGIIEDGFGYEFDAEQIATVDGYEMFAQSAPFKNWLTASSQ